MRIKGSLEGHICREKKIIPNQSFFAASYQGTTTSGDLALNTAKSITSESRCLSVKIEQESEECIAYYILNRLLKIYDTGREDS